MEVVEILSINVIIIRYSQVYDENHIITVDVPTAAAAVAEFQHQMMNRLFHKMSLRVEQSAWEINYLIAGTVFF